jgi:YD repeat-containing protein
VKQKNAGSFDVLQTMTYNESHQPLTVTNASGQTTTYTYNPFGQLETIVSPATGGLSAGRLKRVDGPLDNDVITYGYDELGRVKSRAIDGVPLTYTYDALGRITAETNALGTFSYGYDGVTSRLSEVTYPNGQTTTYAYFGNPGDRRLREIHHKKPPPNSSTLSRFTYTYDAAGNILTWTQQVDSDPANAYDFEYDDAEQLRAATWRTDPTPPTLPTILKRYRYA